jgi:hypothetical protein
MMYNIGQQWAGRRQRWQAGNPSTALNPVNQVTVRTKLAREQEDSCVNLEPHEQDHGEQELEEP